MKRFIPVLFCALLVCLSVRASLTTDVNKAAALSKNGKTAASMVLLNKVMDNLSAHALTHADSLLLLKALRVNAHNYKDLGNSHQSLSLYLRAISIARKIRSSGYLADLYNDVFGLYYARREYDQAEDLLRMALNINLREKDSAAIVSNYNNLGLVCIERRHYKQALQWMDKAMGYTAPADRVGRSLILTNRAEVFLRQDKLTMAEQQLGEALRLQRGVTSDIRTLQTALNMALVKARLGKRSESAGIQREVYAALGRMPLPMRSNSYEQLADIHFILGDSIAALRDILAYLSADDSLRQMNSDSQLQQLLVEYDAERLKQHNANLEQKVDFYRQMVRHRNFIVAGIVAFVCILAALLILLFRRMKIDRAKNELINRQQQQLLAYEQQEHRRRQHELSLEIDHKNRQLTSYTLDLAAVNEFHRKVSASLEALRTGAKRLPGDVDARLQELVFALEHFNDKSLGDDFRVYFDEVHPGFLSYLSHHYPLLSKSDLRLCAYLHLGMSTKEIANLTFKEVRSVESARNRLRKKLGLSNATSLQDFLNSLPINA